MNKRNNKKTKSEKYLFKINWLINSKDLMEYDVNQELVDEILGQIDTEKYSKYDFYMWKRIMWIIINALKIMDETIWISDIENIFDSILKLESLKRAVTQAKAHLTFSIVEYLNHWTARQVI